MASGVHGVRARIGAFREEIEANLVTSISERRFLPIDKLEEIFTLSAVKDAVQELTCQPDDRINLAKTIHHDGKAVFAMLIDMWREDLIINFREHGVFDNQFPLDTVRAREIVGPGIASRLVAEVQWKFLPFVFPERMWECRLHIVDPMILPFVSHEQIGFGAFGDVEKIGVYPFHQNFVDKKEAAVYLVRKQLKAGGCQKEFEREDKCLRLLNGLKHPNIVPFWGSYTHKKEYHFLFPCIETDLGKFLISRDRHGEFHWNFTFFAALTGLASALAKTHRLVLDEEEHGVQLDAIGYHHDLRPPNVLVSHNNFVLADFGLGSLKDADALSHTPYKIISGDYIAPECTDMEEIPQTVNRAIDVWAFGCLILEVVTYMLRGPEGIKSFRGRRLTPARLPRTKDSGFYQPQANGGIKQEVLEWIEELERDSTTTQTDVYLLKLSLDALQANPGKRPSMDEMYQRMAGASMLKHFDSVQDIFQRIRGDEVPPASHEHHIECLRLAQERFEAWGQFLSLREISILSPTLGIHEKMVEVVTSLFHILREEPDKRASGDPTGLRSFQDNVDRRIIELWDLLPRDLVDLANDYLRQKASSNGLHEEIPGPPNALQDKVHSECTTVSGDALLRDFEKLVESFKHDLPDSLSLDELLKTNSTERVYDITDDLQHGQELRNLQRMELSLKRLQSYTETLNDTIRGSSQYAALVWGPLGFLLRRSSTFDKAYTAVIDAIAKVGEALPDFHASDAFLRPSPQNKEILVLLFRDLLEFYGVTLKPFSLPGWMSTFERLWPKVGALISEISSHISRLGLLMRTEISVENIHQEYEFRKTALQSFRSQARDIRRQEFSRIKTSRKPREYDETLYELRGVRSSGSGNWLFSSQDYKNWFDRSQSGSQILWLKGIPGAGKTVLSSIVVDHLKNKQRLTCFAFLTYKDEKISALSMMHSLIFQLAERDDELVDIVCESEVEELKSNLGAATDLLKSLILHAGEVYLVIDGVDEINESERISMVRKLLEVAKSCPGLAVTLSSRPEADLVHTLGNTAVAIQVHDHNEQNIESYITESTQKMFGDRQILRRDHRQKIQSLLTPVAKRAKGMFLYARLIMKMVASMNDMSEIQNELAVLPENLDDAYGRIILRLDKQETKLQVEKAKTLLGWIVCSSIPLTIEEAEQALAVQPRRPGQTYDSFAKLDPVKLLGPIVETVGGYIRFVHFTAKEYVSSAHLGVPPIRQSQATLDLAIRCIEYLCQHHHDPHLSSQEISEKLLTGQYILDAFASRMWFELSCQYLRSITASDVPAALIESTCRLWECRKAQDPQREMDTMDDGENHSNSHYSNEDEIEDEWIPKEVQQQHPVLQHLLFRVSRFRRSTFVYTGEGAHQGRLDSEQDPLSTWTTSHRIHQAMDKTLCDRPSVECQSMDEKVHENCACILYWYGQRPFKCKYPRCEFWRQGFQTRARRNHHELSHETPLKCDVPGCKFGRIGFLSEKMREKHRQEGHTPDPPQPRFDVQNLDKDSLEPLLHYLVAGDQVEHVQKILSNLPNPDTYKTQDLRMLASFAASPTMLQLLWSISKEDQIECTIQSIQGRNAMTMEYNLNGLHEPFHQISLRGTFEDSSILFLLVSKNWVEGMTMWCKRIKRHMEAETGVLHREKASNRAYRLFGDRRLMKEAGKYPFEEQTMKILWNDTGLLAHTNTRQWASRTLRYVAHFGCSVTLAAELLSKGADINFRRGNHERSILQCAATQDSAGGARMMEFLLFRGADPEAIQHVPPISENNLRPREGHMKFIRDEQGAKNIQKWLGKSWDDLLEETKGIRDEKHWQIGQSNTSELGKYHIGSL